TTVSSSASLHRNPHAPSTLPSTALFRSHERPSHQGRTRAPPCAGRGRRPATPRLSRGSARGTSRRSPRESRGVAGRRPRPAQGGDRKKTRLTTMQDSASNLGFWLKKKKR